MDLSKKEKITLAPAATVLTNTKKVNQPFPHAALQPTFKTTQAEKLVSRNDATTLRKAFKRILCFGLRCVVA